METMPISEDEYDSRQGFDHDDRHPSSMSKAELRKTNKPIMEKKRRARINQCLGELKDLILEAMKKDPSRHSKLEKADILEMTVRHLQTIQRRGLAAAAATDPEVLPRFRQGFADCAAEATRFLSRPPALAAPARGRLRQHLAACVAALHQPTAPSIPHDLNGNIHMGGVPLIPSRLPTGELALVLPPNAQLPFTRPISDIFSQNDHHLSAFQSVKGGNRPPSPASSISSCDSLNSDRDTPPHAAIASTFPTPPSQTSCNESSPETQKPIVSSTTISPESRIDQKAAIPDNNRQRGTLWRQTDAQSPQKFSNTNIEALNYSVTPTGKRKMYTSNALNVIPITEPPRKIACMKVSSSQSPEQNYNAQNPTGHSTHKQKEDNQDNQAGPSSAQSSKDMWRPW